MGETEISKPETLKEYNLTDDEFVYPQTGYIYQSETTKKMVVFFSLHKENKFILYELGNFNNYYIGVGPVVPLESRAFKNAIANDVYKLVSRNSKLSFEIE